MKPHSNSPIKAADLPPEIFKAVEDGMAAGRERVIREADTLGQRVNILRGYGPKEEMLTGDYQIPAIQLTK